MRGRLVWILVAFLQVVATQIVTFVLSLLFPGMGTPESMPATFAVLLGVSFSAGVLIVGWLAMKVLRAEAEPKWSLRISGVLLGAFVPMLLALALGQIRTGSPFYLVSVLASVAGFYVAGLPKSGAPKAD